MPLHCTKDLSVTRIMRLEFYNPAKTLNLFHPSFLELSLVCEL